MSSGLGGKLSQSIFENDYARVTNKRYNPGYSIGCLNISFYLVIDGDIGVTSGK